jgi:acetyltransferase-like isoleucine patch superfamily enzyme
MKTGTLVRRFLTPGFVVTVRAYLKYRAMVSPRAEVEITPHLVLGRGTVVSSFTKIKATDGPLRIGRNVEIAVGCMLSAHTTGVEIGDDCLIGPNVTIVGNNYHYDELETPIRLQGKVSSKGIRIAANVWIGSGCCLLDGADIGSGAILTPNTVVSSRIPPNSIVQGNPAKVIFTRR